MVTPPPLDAPQRFVSIVVPAHNEAGRIGQTVRRIADHLRNGGLGGEIIVVDDGSRDGTAKEAEETPHGEALLRVLRLPANRGKGHAIRCGVLDASAPLICFTDADLSVPLAELDRFLRALAQGADIVIGSRRLGGSPLRRWFSFLGVRYQSRIKVHQPFHRELLGEAYHWFVRIFLGLQVMDSNCGFKCFRAAVAKRLFQIMQTDRWGFDAEILLIARRHRYRIREIEVEWYNDPSSKVNLLAAPFSSLAEVLRIKLNDLTGKYRPTAPKV